MTEFIFGRDANTKTEYLLSKIRSEQKAGHRAIVIIPEQKALYWDTISAKELDSKHLMNTEIVSFTRLADSVFRTFGGCAKHYITEGEKTLVMWNAMESVWDSLSYFSEIGRGDKYISTLRHAVTELKMYSVTPADLESAAEKLKNEGNERLAVRLSELSLIYSAYEQLLHISYDDPEEIPDALADTLTNHNYFENAAVFIDSFHTLTPKQMKVLGCILKDCSSVYITFSMSNEDKDLSEYSYVWHYVQDVARLCAKCGSEVKSISAPQHKSEEISFLAENIWNYSAPTFEKETEKISTVYCADRHDEAVLCSAKIKDLVSKGAKYSDIAVVAANMEALEGICDRELERCGIPTYFAGRTPCITQPAVKLIKSALSLCSGGWQGEKLSAIAKSGLCGITPDCADALERYIDIWELKGKNTLCNDLAWQMNPDGYSEHLSLRGAELLRLANEAKDILIPPLEAFSDSFGKSALEICKATYKLLCDFSVYNRLCQTARQFEQLGEADKAQKTSQVWGAICQILDTIVNVSGDAIMDAPTLSALFSKVAETISIGTIPPALDRVILGSAGNVRTEGISHLIVLGASSGEFPVAPAEGSFFSDNDKIALEALGLELSPISSKKLDEELFRFANTVTSPKESLTLLVPAGSDGAVHPSMGALRCRALFENSPIVDFSTADGVEAVRKISACVYKTAPQEIPLDADRDRISKGLINELFPGDLSMTQSKIETFNDCAFKFYCNYILKLDEGKKAAVNAGDVGTFVHKILEDFMREAAEKNVFPVPHSTIIYESDRLIQRYTENAFPENISSRVDYMVRRLQKSITMYMQSLSEEFAQSKFRPVSFEEKIGMGGAIPSMPIPLTDNKAMSISGVVDRIDTYKLGDKVYVRVADYKTGRKDFKPEDVKEGINVQLLLYLFSICQSPINCDFRKVMAKEGEELLPAGAVYFSSVVGSTASSHVLDSDEAENALLNDIKRRGIVSRDLDIIRAMDAKISGKYAPAKLKKDGDFNKTSSCVANSEEFEEIRTSMTEALAKMGDSILSGKACSTPSDGGAPCKYCAMNAICRHNSIVLEDEKGGEGSNE